MTPRLTDRLAHLERAAAPPSSGKHLVFEVEAPAGGSPDATVAFLRERGHAIRDEDSVLVMVTRTVGADGAPVLLRDLTTELVTDEIRSRAGPALEWSAAAKSFTFTLDSPRGDR